MSFEFLDPIIRLLPEVKKPTVPPPFKKRIMWVIVGLIIFFILGEITPFGVLSKSFCEANPGIQGCSRLGFLQNVQTILASNIGTLATLGIGPIVMASIILQLLSGAELIKIEKERYQGVQKLAAVLFCFFEGAIYVYTGFIPIEPSTITLLPIPMLETILSLNHILVLVQIALGSIILLYLDEVIAKWGFGSGIGLFIVAGVAKSIVWGSLSIWQQSGRFIGIIPQFLNDLMIEGILKIDIIMPIIFTLIVFLIVVYIEAMRVEIPLTLGRVRGIGGRYPLKFLYASNLPVILAAALFANVQLFTNVLNNMGIRILGMVDTAGTPIFALNLDPANFTVPIAYMVRAPYGILGTQASIDRYLLQANQVIFGIPLEAIHIVCYTIIMIAACIIFGKFWIETTGMNAKQVSEQLRNVGFSVPGFRRDARVMEKVLNKYIPVITVLGSASVGLLAAGADLTGALGSGTGILLSVGILYRLYEELAQSQLMEMHPALRNFLGG
ncbi:preprotein translocase subunit SecY [archaeon]|nr:preprotein translocase subunit SecY [archaeon]